MNKFFLALIFTLCIQHLNAQCNSSSLESLLYGTGQCNGLSFQSSIGSIAPVYGSSGNLRFTSPLTEGRIITSVINLTHVKEPLIYPNPVMNFLTIEMPDGSKSGSLRVFNSMGNLIFQQEFYETHLLRIDMSSIPAGMYFLHIRDNHSKYFKKKFIKVD